MAIFWAEGFLGKSDADITGFIIYPCVFVPGVLLPLIQTGVAWLVTYAYSK